MSSLQDVQSWPDDRGLPISQVGITGLRFPVSVWGRDQGKQMTVAEIAMSVGLAADVKGTHLSRFLEILNTDVGELTYQAIPATLMIMRRRLGSQNAQLSIRFPYFLPRRAPVTGATALMDYACEFRSSLTDDTVTFSVVVSVPVTSVCPCSKAISDYGAHNQRGVITMEAWPRREDDGFAPLWIEDLVEMAESSASSPVYPLLKRADERYVTMRGYDHPVFVEDMVRSTASLLAADQRVADFAVEAVNDESIHNHGAYARIDRRQPG